MTANMNLNLSYSSFEDPTSESPVTPIPDEILRRCMTETEMSLSEWEQFKENEVITDNEMEVPEALQCFTHCLYERMGLMKGSVFLENNLIQNMLNEGIPIPKECKFIPDGRNQCEVAYQIHRCYEERKKLFSEKAVAQAILAEMDNEQDEQEDQD